VDAPGNAGGDCAPAAFGANTIVLGPNRYNLGLFSELLVDPTVTNLTIKGAGEDKTTIDARFLGDRALEVSAGATVTLEGLTIANAQAHTGANGTQGGGTGGAGANGGGILNEGSLTLNDAAVAASSAGTGGTGGTGTSGAATGGTGGTGGLGGSGGGVYNTGT